MRKKLLIIIIIVLVALITAGGWLVKSVLTVGLSRIVGTGVQMEKLSLDVFKPTLRIGGFKLYNPGGFAKGILLDIPNINIDYDLGALLKREMHFIKMEVNLKELVVIKNKYGKLNVDELRIVKKEQKTAPPVSLEIDYLFLSIGRVVYQDFSRGQKPSIEVFNINIKEKVYKNITSTEQLARLILVETLGLTSIKGTAIYGASTLAGISLLPVGATVLFTGRDSAKAEFTANYNNAYQVALEAIQAMGEVVQENKNSGLLKGRVNTVDVTVKINRINGKTVQIIATARKHLVPKPQVAGGVIYQISQKLK